MALQSIQKNNIIVTGGSDDKNLGFSNNKIPKQIIYFIIIPIFSLLIISL